MNFFNSNGLLERALKLIPNGTQTFSKSRTQYPVGSSPLYAMKGLGCRIIDVDGNPFLDTVSGLGAIILGYGDADVNKAVIRQIDESGAIFSLPHELEVTVAGMLQRIIPSSEMVRFGKNGSDVTSGAVRLARYITGRDHVACCGYHGYQDWYIGITERHGGVPNRVRELTHSFKYNDLDSLDAIFRTYPGEIACVIMEPIIAEWPNADLLYCIREMCHQHGAIFILDEMITGFRMEGLSAQKYWNVIPDLSCFGKAMGNGYPISALVGKAEYMERLSDLHFSFTFGGDCIGLAAAEMTIEKLFSPKGWMGMDWSGTFHYRAKTLQKALVPMCEQYGVEILGYPERLIFRFKSDLDKWKVFQEMLKRRILFIGFINLTYAFQAEDTERIVWALSEILPNLDRIELEFQPIDPLFKVR